MMQKGGMEAPPHRLISTETERNIADPSTDLAAWAYTLDFTSGVDEINRIVAVFRKARANGKNIGVEDDILGVETHLLDKDLVRTLAHGNLLFLICGLTRFIESHHNNGRAVPLAYLRLSDERFLTFL